MLEILIIIGVVKTFASVAQSKSRSKIFWGFIGALSYYVPILLMSFLILPAMGQAGLLQFITRENAFMVGILINLVTGVTCCLMAYLVLKALPDADQGVNPYASSTPMSGDFEREQDDNPYRSRP